MLVLCISMFIWHDNDKYFQKLYIYILKYDDI